MKKSIDKIIGWLVIILIGLGLAALVVGLTAGIAGEWGAAATSLLAAVLAFGLLINALIGR